MIEVNFVVYWSLQPLTFALGLIFNMNKYHVFKSEL